LNILHVSSHDLAGGRFTGYYMQRGLADRQHSVEMAVWDKASFEPHIHSLRAHWPSHMRYLTKVAHWTSSLLALEGLTGPASFTLPAQPYFQRADVVHLHLIHNGDFFSLLPIKRLGHLKPLVWTIHDHWALTGSCVAPVECARWTNGCNGRCPHPRGKSPLRHYMPALHWRVKRNVYRSLPVTLVAASRYMFERVQRSPLLAHLPCHRIPFGIDLKQFAPQDQARSKERLGIPLGNRVIAFRSAARGTTVHLYKGVQWLREALTQYQPERPTSLVILDDASEFANFAGKYHITRMGWADGENLVTALSAADVFLMPSTQDSFGLMAVEAMACGVPVVAFDGTAVPEVINTPRGGVVVPCRDATALAAAVNDLLSNSERLSKHKSEARRLAEADYSLEHYAQRHVSLYQEVVERHQRRPESAAERALSA
jgi:glycosyltransferase involved in cell wall biosynthesis